MTRVAPTDATEKDARAPARFVGLAALRARMDLIATYPIHVNGAYRDRPNRIPAPPIE